MTAKTIMMSFRLKEDQVKGEQVMNVLKSVGGLCFEGGVKNLSELDIGADKLIIFIGESGSHATLRVYSSGLVTLDIQHLISEQTEDNHPQNNVSFSLKTKLPFNTQYMRCLGSRIENCISSICDTIVDSLPTPICRGSNVWRYCSLGNDCLLERDYDKILYHEQSGYQDVKILHSTTLGNVLLLDEEVMMGESDLVYTETLLGLDRQENYFDKEILILGGGDGGVLNELLKKYPKFVIMAEIDETVIHACRTHLRSVCGNAMDQYEGPRYKIRIEDCLVVMKESLNIGKRYDYVINDLTEFPVNIEKCGFNYDFKTSSVMLEIAMQLLKPTGKLMMRGGESSNPILVDKIEQDIGKLCSRYQKHISHVPSFMENYVFFEAWKK